MRTLLLAFTLGALIMSNAVADEPKYKDPTNKDSYDLKATIKKWHEKKFLNPVKDQPVYLEERKGKLYLFVCNPAINTETPKGSEVTIGDKVYVTGEGQKLSGYYRSLVSLKPKE